MGIELPYQSRKSDMALPKARWVDKLSSKRDARWKKAIDSESAFKQEFDKDGLRTDFIDFCMSRMLSATETVASKALCVKMAYKQCIHYEELIQELKQCLDMMQQEQLPPAVISAVNNIRKNSINWNNTMNVESVRDYCLSLPLVTEDFPFDGNHFGVSRIR